jgi:Putative transposase
LGAPTDDELHTLLHTLITGALEQRCRYITRPALADERVQCNAAGQVGLELKTAWRDGTTHLVM